MRLDVVTNKRVGDLGALDIARWVRILRREGRLTLVKFDERDGAVVRVGGREFSAVLDTPVEFYLYELPTWPSHA